MPRTLPHKAFLGAKFRLYIFISPINCSVMVGLNCITYGINKSVITIFFISLTDYFCSCLSCLDFLSNNNLFFNALHTLINKRLALGYIYCFKWYIFLDIFSRIFLHYLSIKSLFWSGFAWTEPTGFKTWRKSNEKVCYILLFLQRFFFLTLFNFFRSFNSFALVFWFLRYYKWYWFKCKGNCVILYCEG